MGPLKHELRAGSHLTQGLGWYTAWPTVHSPNGYCHGAFITLIILLLSLFTGSRKAWEKELYSTVAPELKIQCSSACV